MRVHRCPGTLDPGVGTAFLPPGLPGFPLPPTPTSSLVPDWYTLVPAPDGVESRSGTRNPASLAPPSVQGAKPQSTPPPSSFAPSAPP